MSAQDIDPKAPNYDANASKGGSAYKDYLRAYPPEKKGESDAKKV